MLSGDCEDCGQLELCSKKCSKAVKGERIYCSDGTAHIVSDPSVPIEISCLRMQQARKIVYKTIILDCQTKIVTVQCENCIAYKQCKNRRKTNETDSFTFQIPPQDGYVNL